MQDQSVASVLKKCGIRVTAQRRAILQALKKSEQPRTVEDIRKLVPQIDVVTIYRTLETFVDHRLVRTVRFKDPAVRYEIAHTEHHHHVVCSSCGRISELPRCDVEILESNALRASQFARIDDHSLEFFGICTACA